FLILNPLIYLTPLLTIVIKSSNKTKNRTLCSASSISPFISTNLIKYCGQNPRRSWYIPLYMVNWNIWISVFVLLGNSVLNELIHQIWIPVSQGRNRKALHPLIFSPLSQGLNMLPILVLFNLQRFFCFILCNLYHKSWNTSIRAYTSENINSTVFYFVFVFRLLVMIYFPFFALPFQSLIYKTLQAPRQHSGYMLPLSCIG